MIAILFFTWIVAAGKVDGDGDGIADRIAIESRDAVRYRDRDVP